MIWTEQKKFGWNIMLACQLSTEETLWMLFFGLRKTSFHSLLPGLKVWQEDIRTYFFSKKRLPKLGSSNTSWFSKADCKAMYEHFASFLRHNNFFYALSYRISFTSKAADMNVLVKLGHFSSPLLFSLMGMKLHFPPLVLPDRTCSNFRKKKRNTVNQRSLSSLKRSFPNFRAWKFVERRSWNTSNLPISLFWGSVIVKCSVR